MKIDISRTNSSRKVCQNLKWEKNLKDLANQKLSFGSFLTNSFWYGVWSFGRLSPVYWIKSLLCIVLDKCNVEIE